ncbi:MAG: hypothetical protein ABI310_05645 [Microbacteriaceae bacterium]
MKRPAPTVGKDSAATQLSAVFAGTLTDACPQFGVRRRYIGIEHEYVVHAAGKRVDFRELIRSLDIDGEAIDPADALARRCRWGGVVTADGPEAEIATPPVALDCGFSERADVLARVGRFELERSARGHRFEGYSTHISISMDDHVVQAAAQLYAERFAAALMLLLDSPSSPGLLVRPRPGRLELCGDHADGDRLRAASLFAAGSALAAERAVTDRAFRRELPPRLRVATVPSVQRFGLYVDRAAFGCDLYRHGRSSMLRKRRGGWVTANEHLRLSWRCARSTLVGVVDDAELHAVDALVCANTPLPTDQQTTKSSSSGQSGDDSVFGRALNRRERPDLSVACTWLAWHVAVFTVSNAHHSALAVVPASLLEQFLGELDAGTLEEVLEAYLATSSTDRVVASTDAAGLYDDLGDAGALNLDELGRDGEPLHGRGSGSGTPSQRPGKEQETPGPPSSVRRLPPRRLLIATAVATLIAVLIAVIVVSAGGDSPKETAVTTPPVVPEVPVVPVATSVAPAESTSTSSSTTSSSTSTVPATSSTVPVVVRTGPISGGATATQDGGEFAMAITMEVLTPTVPAGQEMTVHWTGTLDGPNWIRNFSTGKWSITCADSGSHPRRTGTLRAFLIPTGVAPDPSTLYSIRATQSAADALETARAQYPGLLLLSTEGVITNNVVATGCNLKDNYESTLPLQIPVDTPAGEYYVVSVSYPKRDWGTCPASCTASYGDIVGVVPTVMIEPSV